MFLFIIKPICSQIPTKECSLLIKKEINTFLLVSECKKAEEPQSSHKAESDEQKSDDKRKDTWAEAEENEKREKENRRKEADREQNIKTQILNAALNHVKT